MNLVDATTMRRQRLRSHRLTAPAASPAEAARHMLAVQSQEFWGGRWALASRSRGAPTIRAIDALFESGELVRSWTQRGTLHIVAAADLLWMLRVTGHRQLAAAAPRYRRLGLDHEVLARAERAIVSALRGGGRLTRAELFGVLDGIGIDPSGQRGVHAVQNLALRGIICQGPVVPRESGISREQFFVLVDEHVAGARTPADPDVELFVRYIDGHGPATAEDFAWWSGLTLGSARAAASAAQLEEVEQGVYASAVRPRRSRTASVFALASFEEYYISYADRSPVAAEAVRTAVGPGRNGMVRPVIVADGEVIGAWRPSTALGRHAETPAFELFADGTGARADAPTTEIAAALERYTAFITG